MGDFPRLSRIGDGSAAAYPTDSPTLYVATRKGNAVACFSSDPTATTGGGAAVILRGSGNDSTGAILGGNVLGLLGFRGLDSAAWATASAVKLYAYASETWSPTAHGAHFAIATTPAGTATALDRVYVLDSGFVGLGGTPSQLLDLVSTAPGFQMTDTTASAKSLRVVVDANVAAFFEAAGAAGDILSLDLANKRVGVGTLAPSYALHVANTAAGGQTTVMVEGGATGAGWARLIMKAGTRDMRFFVYPAAASSRTKDQWWLYDGTASALRFLADEDGNIGIGDISAFGASAAGVLGIKNGTAPTTSPANMGQLYVESGALKYRGAGGTLTTLANSADADAPARDTLRVVKETVFAGLGAASYSNGSTTTIDGCGYTCTVAGNGAVDMVATGLRFRQGTTSGANFQIMSIAPGNTGDFATLLGAARWRRGRWAFWTRLASYDFTNSNAQILGVIGELAHLTGTKWAISHRRNRNAQGAPNTTTGGLAIDYWWNGSDQNPTSYVGVSTVDVVCSYVRSPDQVDIYLGTYSGGWPTLEAMTYWGTLRMSAVGYVANTPTEAGVSIRFYLGGSAATTGTYEIIVDRWRLTTWE